MSQLSDCARSGGGRRLWGGRKTFSYRVEDFVKVDETDGDADDLEEDGCEGDEPQTLQRS